MLWQLVKVQTAGASTVFGLVAVAEHVASIRRRAAPIANLGPAIAFATVFNTGVHVSTVFTSGRADCHCHGRRVLGCVGSVDESSCT